jgi:hypothetical protein
MGGMSVWEGQKAFYEVLSDWYDNKKSNLRLVQSHKQYDTETQVCIGVGRGERQAEVQEEGGGRKLCSSGSLFSWSQ